MLDVATEFLHMGYAYGQHDWRLRASVDDEQVGFVTFAEYAGVPCVRLVYVEPEWRRMGIATRMLANLQARYDGVEIDLGTQTEEGAELFRSLPWVVVPNTARQACIEDLARIEETIGSYRRLWDDAVSGAGRPREEALRSTSDWNDLSDAADELRRQVEEEPVEHRFIDYCALLAPEHALSNR